MLSDFLSACRPIVPDETDDYKEICCELVDELFVGYIPSVIFDLWPLHVLQHTSAKQYAVSASSYLYLMPIGAHQFWAKTEFERLILDFYRNDEFPSDRNTYDFDLEEMILLQYPGATERLNLCELGNCNAVYMRVSKEQHEAHIIVLMETPSDGWEKIVEHYGIATDILIDSHRGLGNWFEDTKLYSHMNATEKRLLLPEYYFKGKYISHWAPDGFSLLQKIDESGPHDCMSEIYRTPWHN